MKKQAAFHGFSNPADPTTAELRAWAYDPDSMALEGLPPDWDLLVSGDSLITTLYDLAADPECPARRFAMHCLYTYAGNAVRTDFQAHSKRKVRRLIDRAGSAQDENLRIWGANTQALLNDPTLFDYRDWCQGGLVRRPRRLLT